MFIPCTEA